MDHIAHISAGTLISVPTHLMYRHFGIVTARGTVISNSIRSGSGREESFAEFSGGKIWRIEPRPSDMPWREVLARARTLMGRRYNLFTWNCECFVKSCYGLPPSSDQLALSLLVGFAGIAVIAGLNAE